MDICQILNPIENNRFQMQRIHEMYHSIYKETSTNFPLNRNLLIVLILEIKNTKQVFIK